MLYQFNFIKLYFNSAWNYFEKYLFIIGLSADILNKIAFLVSDQYHTPTHLEHFVGIPSNRAIVVDNHHYFTGCLIRVCPAVNVFIKNL